MKKIKYEIAKNEPLCIEGHIGWCVSWCFGYCRFCDMYGEKGKHDEVK